jgi:hypothetical protein
LLNEVGKQNIAQFKEALEMFEKRLEKIDVICVILRACFNNGRRKCGL